MKKLLFYILFLAITFSQIAVADYASTSCDTVCKTQKGSSYTGTCRGTAPQQNVPNPFPSVNINSPSTSNLFYGSHKNLVQMFIDLCKRHEGYCSYVSIGKTNGTAPDGKRDIVMFRIGTNTTGNGVMWDGSLHGWEDAGSVLEYYISEWLLEDASGTDVNLAKDILENNYILFIPVINMDSSNRCNKNYTANPPVSGNDYYGGVDLNRNFYDSFSSKTPPVDCENDYYPGPFAASESETRAMISVFQKYKPKFLLNIHYGGGPWMGYYGSNSIKTDLKTKINEISSNRGVTSIFNWDGYEKYNWQGTGGNGMEVGDAHWKSGGVTNAFLFEVGNRTKSVNDICTSFWSHKCCAKLERTCTVAEALDEMSSYYFPRMLPIFLAMTELSEIPITRPPCDSGETSVGRDDCNANFTCCCAASITTCSDGTPINTCSAVEANKPKWCDSTGGLISNQCNAPHNCPCPTARPICNADGSCSPKELVGYWKFDETTGTTATDSSGKGSIGSLMPSCPDCPSRFTGRVNNGLRFDGSNDYVKINDKDVLDVKNGITISAWIYLSAWSTYSRIVSKESTTSADPYALEINNTGRSVMLCINAGGGEKCIDSGLNSIYLNSWIYVAGTWDGTYSKIYVNGVWKNTKSLSGSMAATSNNFLIGNNPSNNRQFNGMIDEVKIYNYALGASEISNEYSSAQYVGGGGGGGCPFLEAWNGDSFVKIEKLNIHAPKGTDTFYSTSFSTQPIDGKYELVLKEADYISLESFLENPDGSNIDSIKLVDSFDNECRLISAVHSKQGDVLSTLQNSDDVRIQTLPNEEIRLVYDDCSGNDFTFSIEGYNMFLMKFSLSYIKGIDETVLNFIFVVLMLCLQLLILAVLEKFKIV